ncbi:MAG: NAD(P)-binding protein [Oscillospiraceae bacterium]
MQYDAAIIGAGPAGATFARRLAQQSPELKILLLDAQDEGHKKPCGGLLAPDAQKTLAHFDLVLPKSVLADPQIFAVETMDLRTRRVRYYQRYYLNMDRYAFDRWLVSLVPPTVEIVRGRCTAVSRTDGASSSPCGRRRALGRSPAAASSARTARGPSCARPFSTGPSTDICRCSSGSARRTRLSLFIPASLIPKPVKAARG